MSIYTKKGDGGETGLPGKRRLAKADQLFEVLGTLDETNACIGLARSCLTHQNELGSQLEKIQRQLLTIGATLAAETPNKEALTNLSQETTVFEQLIDRWEGQLPELKNFILPGGGQAGASLHLCRTIVRRLERNYQRLPNDQKITEISTYLNRLSDFFFQAARWINHQENQAESIWKV